MLGEQDRDRLADAAERQKRIGQVQDDLEAASVPLPNREVKPLETWKSRRDVVVGSATLDMTIIGTADYRYTYLGMTERNGKKVAFVSARSNAAATARRIIHASDADRVARIRTVRSFEPFGAQQRLITRLQSSKPRS